LGWRGWLLIAVGIVIGATAISPAVGHVTSRFGHVWKQHIKPKADKRYVLKCEFGAVKASAWILGDDGSYDMTTIPSSFTPAKGFINDCMPGQMLIRRDGVGRYVVAFQDGAQRIAVANPDQTYGAGPGVYAQTGFALHYGGGINGNSVTIRTDAGAFVDSPFMIWMY
jgi:hypothetical protein